MTLGVVDGNPVGGHVDARGVNTTDAQRGVTYSRSGVAGGDAGGSCAHKVGDVLPVIGAAELLA